MKALSGFPEFLPGQQILFDQWKAQAAHHFQRHGFWPLETPAVERLSALLSKGDDHEIYQVMRFKDEGVSDKTLDQKMGLRFDLTVPLARYVTTHQGHLVFPYRRYHIGPVWRGERAQKGRYRQFYQCDIDVVGRKTLSDHYSGEMIGMMDALVSLLDTDQRMGPLHWTISHRCLLNRWADHAGIVDKMAALRWIDKRGKTPFETIITELSALGASTASLDQLMQWAHDPGDVCTLLRALTWGDDFQGALSLVTSTIRRACLLGADNIVFDPLLARGLTYYSGLTYEATLKDHPTLGAVCAGGQYDGLTASLGSKESFPGVGVSLGLSRLFSCAVETTSFLSAPPADVLVTMQDPAFVETYLGLAQTLRQGGVAVESYLEPRPLSDQLKYANTQGHPFAIMANETEMCAQQAIVKILSTRVQKTMPWSQIPAFVRTEKS
jgi:histidyl-tRNA synthetase